MSETGHPVYEFGPFRLDARERQLAEDGRPIPLTDKVFELLLLLVQNAGHVLSKAELMARIWPDAVVEENNLTVNVSILRKALGESASDRRYIETVSRRGYRFAGALRAGKKPTPEHAHGAEPRPPELGAANPAPFVGRERELSQLQQWLKRALAGHGRVVFVSGDAGMGKTEFCERFLLAAYHMDSSLLFATGRCLEQYGTREAYLPFLEALRGLLMGLDARYVADLLRLHAPSWCSQFPALLTPALGDRDSAAAGVRSAEPQAANAARMLREFADALEALSSSKPVVLFLEDLHWADPSSSDLLQWLCRRIKRSRILILSTLRAEQVDREEHPLKNIKRELLAHDLCTEFALDLLRSEHIARYLHARFGAHEFPPQLAELVASTSGGHPLFATRLVDMLADRGDITLGENGWHLARPVAELKLGVPVTVRGVIERKLELLEATDRRALQYASVVGAEFSSATLARILAADEVSVEERLDHLSRAHRLVELMSEERLPDGQLTLRYRFAHVLYRQVLYESLASKRRMLLHRQAAEALLVDAGAAAPTLAAQLALHFEAARDFERAIRYAMQAADNAGRLHANREAQQHYDHALALLPELAPSERMGPAILLHYNRGWASYKVGNTTEASREFEAMRQRASDPEFTGSSEPAERARAVVFEYLSEPWRDAFGVQAMPRMPNQDRSMGAAAIECEAYAALSYALLRSNRLDELDERLREFLRLAEASRNEPRISEALAWMAFRQLRAGHLSAAAQLAERSIRGARSLGHERSLSLALYARARVHYLMGEYGAAEQLFLEALELSFEAEGRLGVLLGLGVATVRRGLVSAGLARLTEALGIAKQTELTDSLLHVTRAIAGVLLDLGAWERAKAHLERAVELARGAERRLVQAECHLGLARAYEGLGDRRSADAEFAAAEAARPEHTPENDPQKARSTLYLDAARARYLLRRGELERAADAASRVLEMAALHGSREQRALAHHLMARVELERGDSEAAHANAEAGLRVLTEESSPFVRWKLLAALGIALLRAAKAKAAHGALGPARALIDQLARGIDDSDLRAAWLQSPDVALVLAETSPSQNS